MNRQKYRCTAGTAFNSDPFLKSSLNLKIDCVYVVQWGSKNIFFKPRNGTKVNKIDNLAAFNYWYLLFVFIIWLLLLPMCYTGVRL